MDFTELGKHGISGMLVMVIWYLVHQKQAKNGGTGKHDFMEELGRMMAAQTKILNESHEHIQKMAPVIMATDDNLIPRSWADKKQGQRTHDNVSNLVDIQTELVKVVQDTYLEVKKHA